MTHYTYVIDRYLLDKMGRALQPAEQVRFITGLEFPDGVIVLQHPLTLKAETGLTHATPDPASIARAQEHLLTLGLEIHAQFHSHPGQDAGATHPSTTDLETARRWENGSPFLGAIFSNNGRYVRFFNHKQESKITIYGTHYRQLDDHLFELYDPRVQATTESPGVSDGPTRATPVVEPGRDQQG